MKSISLSGRDNFADRSHVPSRLAFEGRMSHAPLVSIAIPTFRRFDLLCEAVESALAQTFDREVEIVVVDNEPASDGAARLVERFPQLQNTAFRYYVNAENLGMFGNWNRCIELGRGTWHTLLNDDDRLAPLFCAGMFTVLDAHPEIDGAICRKRLFGAKMPAQARSAGAGKALLRRAWLEYRFHGRSYRRLSPDKFFWGSLVGNTVGFVARKRDLVALGGYDPNDYPSADHLLMLRFAMARRFVEVREFLADVRLEENESARPEVLLGFVERNQDIRRTMAADGVVPRWWLPAFSGLMVSRHRAVLEEMFAGSISDADLEAVTGIRAVKDRKRVLDIACAALNGF